MYFSSLPALFLVPLIGALWYVLPFFIKKETLSKLLSRISQSPNSKTLARLGNNRIFRLFNLALNAFMIADAIYSSPKHPRFSLLTVVIYMALSFGLLIPWASEVLERKIYETLNLVVELNVELQRIANSAYNMAMSAHEYIQKTEPSHDEAHKTTVVALRKLFDTLELVAATARIQADASSKEIDGGKAENGDAEPTKP